MASYNFPIWVLFYAIIRVIYHPKERLMVLIRLENVQLIIRKKLSCLGALAGRFEKGQTWAILGLNGAGRSPNPPHVC